MKSLAIMQPYLFPYIGTFQLINAASEFVIHDDVQWIKGGWINRNRILINGQAQFFTLPLENASSHLNINQRHLAADADKQKLKILRQIDTAYRKAPQYEPVRELVNRCFDYEDRNVAGFVTNSLKLCCEYLGISTPFFISSELTKNDTLRAQARVIEINKVLGAQQYINPASGKDLYDKAEFAKHGIKLSFLQPQEVKYSQLQAEFVPDLSIVDVMMFNDRQTIQSMLEKYELV